MKKMESYKELQRFYKNKKIFVTGHTGFKGSWLVKILNMFGAEITGYSLKPSTKPSLFEVGEIQELACNYYADIRDLKKVKEAMEDSKPDIVFHLAAQPLVRESYINPVYTFETNVIGTVNILEAIRDMRNIRVAIMVTTDKVYENKNDGRAYKETDRLGGHDPYSSSKACAEFAIQSYRSSFFNQKDTCNIASVRAGNIIGGGDWSKDRLIPDIIRAVYEKKHLKLRYPHATRPWQYILDALYGYLLLGKRLYYSKEYASTYNFAPSERKKIEVITIVEMAQKMLGRFEYSISEGNASYEAQLLALNPSKAQKFLGWKPKIKINDTLMLTFQWYKAYYEKNEGTKELENQIKKYFQM